MLLVNKTQETAILFYENDSRSHEVLQDFLCETESKSIMFDRNNAHVFIGDKIKSGLFTIHQICKSHANNKFVKAGNQGSEPVV